jgi:hypothetical protein
MNHSPAPPRSLGRGYMQRGVSAPLARRERPLQDGGPARQRRATRRRPRDRVPGVAAASSQFSSASGPPRRQRGNTPAPIHGEPNGMSTPNRTALGRAPRNGLESQPARRRRGRRDRSREKSKSRHRVAHKRHLPSFRFSSGSPQSTPTDIVCPRPTLLVLIRARVAGFRPAPCVILYLCTVSILRRHELHPLPTGASARCVICDG